MKNIKVITKTGKTYTSELNQSKSINTPVSTWECNGIMMIDVITPNLDNGWFMPIAEIKLLEIDLDKLEEINGQMVEKYGNK